MPHHPHCSAVSLCPAILIVVLGLRAPHYNGWSEVSVYGAVKKNSPAALELTFSKSLYRILNFLRTHTYFDTFIIPHVSASLLEGSTASTVASRLCFTSS